MKHKNFEDFLMDYWGRHDGSTVLDDNCPDAFNDWLADLDSDTWIELGDKYMKEAALEEAFNELYLMACKKQADSDPRLYSPRMVQIKDLKEWYNSNKTKEKING